MALLRWAVLAGLVFVGSSLCFAENPPPSVEATASARTIAVGDTFRLDLRFEWKEGTDVKPVAVADKIGSFVVKDIVEGPVSAGAGISTRKASLLLTTFDTGAQTVPPIPIIYINQDGSGGKVETNPVAMEVKSVLPEDAADIRDIKHPLRVPKRWKDILLSYALVIGLAAAAGLSVLVSFKRKEEIQGYLSRLWLRVFGPVRRLVLQLLALLGLARRREGLAFDIEVDEPGLAPGEAALKELGRIQALGLLERGLLKEHYTLVSETLRRYLEKQCGVLAMESPTGHTLRALSGLDLPAQAYGMIEEVLDECDLVKFAKYAPAKEAISSLIERSRSIVTLTANLSLVPDAWFLAQQYPETKVKIEAQTAAQERGPDGRGESPAGAGPAPHAERSVDVGEAPEGDTRGGERG